MPESVSPSPTADTGLAPCPFEGAWDLVRIDIGDTVPFEDGSVANMTGTAEVCEWDLVLVRSGCRRRELAVLQAEPFGAWTAWSDGAPEATPTGCAEAREPIESRAYPELSDDGRTLILRYNSAHFLNESPTFRLERLN